MLNMSEKSYCVALKALKDKEYRFAADLFEKAAPFFKDNREFELLKETNRLLLVVKQRLAEFDEEETEVIQESLTDG